MNITIKTEVMKMISNDHCKVVMVDGAITSIRVEKTGTSIEFRTLSEYEQFLNNLIDVYHSVVLEQIDERKRSAEGPDCQADSIS